MWSLGVGFFHVVSSGTRVSDSYDYSEGVVCSDSSSVPGMDGASAPARAVQGHPAAGWCVRHLLCNKQPPNVTSTAHLPSYGFRGSGGWGSGALAAGPSDSPAAGQAPVSRRLDLAGQRARPYSVAAGLAQGERWPRKS